MIATYIHKPTNTEVYIQNFTAIGVKQNLEKDNEKIVLFKIKGDNITTYVVSYTIFQQEFTKL